MTIYNNAYFTKGNLETATIVVEETNYLGEVTDIRSYTGSIEGTFTLTLAWDNKRDTKTFSNFRQALTMSNGYWARQAIWHETPEGRKRVMRWA